jgi:hypothetical protein
VTAAFFNGSLFGDLRQFRRGGTPCAATGDTPTPTAATMPYIQRRPTVPIDVNHGGR